ncbi:hypothetical protein LTR84_005772 [Exophiala bonariae]|uniref:Phytanoyl-CoA dioxygenase n=1 Tax=Exophiala bonariae TaxID=1690606 RepID=A0AAV9N450_9EURO|nr:hypothetical protein LTR84_005772 [Exophiala bonariae]
MSYILTRSLDARHVIRARMASLPAMYAPLVKAFSSSTPSRAQPVSIRATPEERASGRLSEQNLETAVRHVRKDGLVVVQDVVEHEILDKLNEKMVQDALELRSRGANSPFNYNKGNLQQDPPPVERFFFPQIFTNPIATQITSAVLGPRPKLTFCSGNSAMPPVAGAAPERQPVHSDADFAHPDHAFALVVNVPLIEMNPKNGSTEVWLGTHDGFGLEAQEGLHGERASGRITESLLETRRRTDPPSQPVIPKGSIIIRDLRLWHAGMPNHTDDVRVMLAMIHFAPWYRNQMKLELAEEIKPLVEQSKELDIRVDWRQDKSNSLIWPRKLAGNHGSQTCRLRKLKCDEGMPIRHQRITSAQKETTNAAEETISSFEHEEALCSLRNEQVAQLFEHYLQVLALWYDLNDLDCTFARLVSREAQKSQLLLNAILAFAAMHKCRTGQSSLKELGHGYHNRCLRLLIELQQSDEAVSNGTALVTTCLLRSYEILAEEKDPNCHLFGAFSLLPDLTSTLPTKPLLLAGLWNYLREDITFALINEYPLKTNIGNVRLIASRDDDYANQITLLLARVINTVFLDGEDDGFRLDSEVKQWHASLPFQPYHEMSQDQGFSRILFLHNSHVAALQYYHVAMMLLNKDCASDFELDHHARTICSLALSSRSDAVMVANG